MLSFFIIFSKKINVRIIATPTFIIEPKEIAKRFLDWAISDNAMKKYATNYPIVATGVGGTIPEGYPENPVEQLLPIDFNVAAQNREATLEQWSERYDAKSAQKEQ